MTASLLHEISPECLILLHMHPAIFLYLLSKVFKIKSLLIPVACLKYTEEAEGNGVGEYVHVPAATVREEDSIPENVHWQDFFSVGSSAICVEELTESAVYSQR